MTQKIHLPSVDRLLQQLAGSIAEFGRQPVTACVRAELAAAREGLLGGLPAPDEADLLAAVRRRAADAARPRLRPVFNPRGRACVRSST